MANKVYFDRVMAATLPEGAPLDSACTAVPLSSIACQSMEDIISYLSNNGASASVSGLKASVASDDMKGYVLDQCIDCPMGSTDKVCESRSSTGEVGPPKANQIGLMFAKTTAATDGRAAAKKIAIPALGVSK